MTERSTTSDRDRSARGDPARDAPCWAASRSSAARACSRVREGPARGARTAAAAAARRVHARRTSRFLDEIADTILPTTKTPGAKAAKTGAFMALMVTDTYSPADQKHLPRRDARRSTRRARRRTTVRLHGGDAGAAARAAHASSTGSRRRTWTRGDARESGEAGSRCTRPPRRRASKAGEAYLPDQRKESGAGRRRRTPRSAITADTPPHYFRMMKELALLGYFTSEIGCTQAMRYAESPGRFDPCVPYKPGEKAWAPHA